MPKEVVIDPHQLSAMCRLKPSLDDVAAFFQCCPKTIDNFIRKRFHLTFYEFREQNMVHTRNSIIRALLEEAVKKRNIAALIFCAKNLCGWSDRNDIQTSEKKAETLKEVPTVTLKAFAREQANKLKEEGARPN